MLARMSAHEGRTSIGIGPLGDAGCRHCEQADRESGQRDNCKSSHRLYSVSRCAARPPIASGSSSARRWLRQRLENTAISNARPVTGRDDHHEFPARPAWVRMPLFGTENPRNLVMRQWGKLAEGVGFFIKRKRNKHWICWRFRALVA